MVKINEFFNQDEPKSPSEMPWNMAEDLIVFMRNDPMFYRKEYYPTMARLSDSFRRGKKFDFAKEITPMLDKAKQTYCKKFKMPRSPESLFTEADNESVCEKLREEEFERIKKGEY